MGRRKASTFTEVELEFMKIIWELGEVSTEDVRQALHSQGRKLSDGSIRKMLSILLEKGHVSRCRRSHSFFYRANAPKGKSIGKMAQQLIDSAFQGSSALMMAALIENKAVDERDIRQIKKLIEDFDKGK